MSVFEMIVADMVPATSLAVPFIGEYHYYSFIPFSNADNNAP